MHVQAVLRDCEWELLGQRASGTPSDRAKEGEGRSDKFHKVGWEETPLAICLSNPPSLVNFLYVLNDVVRVEADLVIPSYALRRVRKRRDKWWAKGRMLDKGTSLLNTILMLNYFQPCTARIHSRPHFTAELIIGLNGKLTLANEISSIWEAMLILHITKRYFSLSLTVSSEEIE